MSYWRKTTNNPGKKRSKKSGPPSHISKTAGKHPGNIPKKSVRGPVSKEEAISRIPFLEGLSETEFKKVAPYFSEYRFKRNQYIFWEGDPATKFYIIRSGRVKLLKTSASGREMVLEVMVPGQLCGGTALFGDTHRNGAQAVEPTIAYGMSQESYEDLLSDNPKIAGGIIKYLGAKLMDAHDVIISLVSSKVESRIASVIVRLCENHGALSDDGILINIRLTRQDIADIVGSTVETTIRTISKFKKQGLLATVGGRLLVKDINAFMDMMK